MFSFLGKVVDIYSKFDVIVSIFFHVSKPVIQNAFSNKWKPKLDWVFYSLM